MRQSRAFCPGHITGFFQICRHEDVLETGSRGAGFSIKLGAESRVVLEEGTGRTEVFIDGARAKAIVTKMAVERLIADEGVKAKVFTTLQLPISQGFGMSAAGALSAAFAVSKLLGKGEDAAYEAAHEAEVVCGTGLGDVAAIKCGGIEFRVKEGLQPRGEVLGIDGNFDMLLCRVGPIIDTASVILDPERSASINKAGERCIAIFAKDMNIHRLLELSNDFLDASGLVTGKVRKALDAVGKDGRASMCMVGSSIFVIGPDLGLLEERMSRFGAVFKTSVDHEGPRLL